MQRREFIRQSAIATAAIASTSQIRASTPTNPIARRKLGKTGEQLSIIGFGGIVVMDDSPARLRQHSSRSPRSWHQLFRRSPQLRQCTGAARPGAGALPQQELPGLQDRGPHERRLAQAARRIPALLKTDHVDLYQFHALTKMTDLDKVLGPGGAMETMEAAKKEGKIRFIGFSVHSAETALAAMDRYNFDTVLFPVTSFSSRKPASARRFSRRPRKRTWASWP